MRCIPRTISAVLVVLAVTVTGAQAQPAPDANSVLILGSTEGIEQEIASALGFTVVVDSEAQWLARTTADFATFQAIILGDAFCVGYGGATAPYLTPAETNRAVWS